MIYRVVLDDTIDLHTSDINCMLLNPSLDLEMNSAGSFNFTLPPSHPYWDAIKVLKSTIDVYEDGDLIFTGRIASIEKNWNNERVVQCEGALAYFNDSIHRQMKWETPLPIASEDPTVHNFLKDILDNHNVFEGAENSNRHIFIGNITVDPEVVTREVNYDTTLDILTRMCIDTNGGYMSVRKDLDDGKLYLDWIKDFTEESGQPAQFGLNLLNFDTSLAAEDICTGVLARGAEVNEQTVTLNDVELVDETTYPDMSVTHYTTQYQDILWHREGVAKFGQVVQVHDFSDAQTAWKDGQGQIVANSLFEMAKKWLEEKNTKIETIEVEVAELAWLGEGMPKYKLGQIVELSDNVHMAGESYETRLLPMYKLSCDLNSGSKKVTLGTPPKKELTQISASNSDSSTLSSSGSSSGSGGSGEGEECRVHDVKVNGTSVVTDKIANVQVPTDTVTASQMAQAINTAVSPKANTADVNQALAQKQDNLVFNSQDAATAHLTKIKNGNDVYDIPTGTEVEANPTGTATSDLTKLKVGSDIYGIPSGGTTVVANPSDPATDDLNTIKIGNTVYDIPGGGGNNYGKFKCDVLFVNNPLPTPTSGTSDVIKTYTLNHSIDDYDAVVVEAYGIYFLNDSSNPRQKVTVLVMKNDYYENTQSTEAFRSASPHHNQLRVLDFDFSNSTTINTNAHRTESGNEPILYKVYGLKFENKLINRSDIYSEEERMIGRWTDGKPLYQITLSGLNMPNNTNISIDISYLNIDKIAFSYGNMMINGSTIVLPQGNDRYIEEIASYSFTNNTSLTLSSRYRDKSSYVATITIQYTKTTDTADSGVLPEDPMFISDPMIYSEEEQIVGSWTDGKPLYQKTITVSQNTSTNNSSWTNVPCGTIPSNIEAIRKFDIIFMSIYQEQIMLNESSLYRFRFNGTDIQAASINNGTLGSGTKITIQYTKTTDSILSGPKKGKIVQRSDIYSEEERLVGRWTDGKPLYQKTVYLQNVTINKDSYTSLTLSNYFSNVENAISYDVTDDLGRINPLINANSSYKLYDVGIIVEPNSDKFTFSRGNSSNITKSFYFTLRYTKTTDTPFSKQLIEDPQFVMMSDIYSEDEQVIGRWTDGKPLYQKTLTVTTPSQYGQATNVKNVTDYSIDTCLDIFGYIGNVPLNWEYDTNYNSCWINSAKNGIIMVVDNNMINKQAVITLQYTKTTDAPGTGPTKGNLIYLPALYSEEEREVGVWTDGKPLYQKTVNCRQIPSNGSSSIPHNVSNMETGFVVSAFMTNGDSFETVPSGENSNFRVIIDKSDNIRIITSANWSNWSISFVTLQYTKTTDQPGSATWTPEGQLAHHYSTSEKIVGTWIDGSTVYERTWDFSADPKTVAYNSWTSLGINIPNAKELLNSEISSGAGGIDACGIEFELRANDNYSVYAEYNQNANLRKIKYLTLQYTKSS